MPRAVRVLLWLGLAGLLLAGGMAWLARGNAILLELSSGAARLLCL
jgi:hypothetical protein